MQDIELALLMDRFMRHIHFGLQKRAPDFDRESVGPSGGIILMTLSDMGRPSLNKLTKRIVRDKSQMTRTIQSLETKGLVQREPCQDDGRVSLVSLTSEGERVVEELMQAVATVIDEVLKPLSHSERKALKRLLAYALLPD